MERGNGENMTGKLLALLLAVILWVYVMNEQNPPVEQTASVKLEVRNVTQGLILADSAEAVKVRYRGPRSIIAGLRSQDLEAYVDANGIQEGEHFLPVKAGVPSSLELIEVAPNTVAVRLEGQTSRQLPVTPKFTGSTPAGVIIDKAEVVPVQVTVAGPRSMVDMAANVVASVDMSGINKDAVLDTIPHVYGKNGSLVKGVTVVPEKVQVQINILKGIIVKTVDIKPVITGEVAHGNAITGITTDPEKVEIRGQAEVLTAIEWLNTMPVNVGGKSADMALEVKIQPREGITFIKGDTVKILIRIGSPP